MKQQKVIHGGDIFQAARRTGLSPEDIVDFSGNINPLGIPEGLKTFILDRLDTLGHYPDMEYLALRTALAAYAGCSADQVMVGNGGVELLSLLFRAQRPKKALIPSPTFNEYERDLNLLGVEVVPYRLKEELDYDLDLEGLLSAFEPGIDLLILCNPNNPTGRRISREVLLSLLDYTREHRILTLVDETFIEFVKDISASQVVTLLPQYMNLVVLRGFSKFFALPGLRLGYMMADPSVLQWMYRYKEPWTVNSIADAAGAFLVSDQALFQTYREWVLKERAFLYEKLSGFPRLKAYESEANFFLIKLLHTDMTASDVKEHLEGKGLLIRDLSSFYYLDPSYFRVAIHTRENNLALLEGLTEILQPA